MNEPRGYNPIGQSAPGLPRHDASVPGHLPGDPYALIDGAGGGGGFNTSYTGPGLTFLAKPGSICTYYGTLYILAPVVAALYPIAGAGGVAGAGLLYLLARITGGGYDRVHEWAWFGCFLGLAAVFRFEMRVEASNPQYVILRRRLRLACSFFGLYYTSASDGNPIGVSLLTAAAGTVIVHFVLRSKALRFIWHSMQTLSGARKESAPVKAVDEAL